MKNPNRNIQVFAVNNDGKPGFNVYIDFSGQREYVMTHRHSGLLYNLLKDGVPLTDIQNFRYGKKKSSKVNGSVKYLNVIINEYMLERETC